MRLLDKLLAIACLAPFFAHAHGTLGYDLGYYMRYEEAVQKDIHMNSQSEVSLSEIVRVGGRAVQWADLIQQNIPVEHREQVWRRSDRLGHEATPQAPLTYNPSTIRQKYDRALATASPEVRGVITGHDTLPMSLPPGVDLQSAMVTVRKINDAYSSASRWLALSQWRSEIPKGVRDLRPWLQLNAQKESLTSFVENWNQHSESDRTAFVRQVATGCPIFGTSQSTCEQEYLQYTSASDAPMAQWLNEVLSNGEQAYNEHFGVRQKHPGVSVSQQPNGELDISFFLINVPSDLLGWISEQVQVGWHFPEVVSVNVAATETNFQGVVKIEWEQGALPHVNDIAGDTVTMDSNTARWLELTRIVMTHEFGHVIGFADCYTEFWDEDVQSFVYYTLDPEDRMCALSGQTLERHKQALLAGYNR